MNAGAAPAGAAFGFARVAGTAALPALAGTTPLPSNWPGLEVAAIAGLPWFTEASSALLVLAACSCWVCRGVAATCGWRAAACSCGVGLAVVPPVPPLKLALVALLIAYHGYCYKLMRDFAQNRNARTARWYRLFNEVPSLFLIAIVALAVVKP